jgi:hypothetical protein
MKPNYSQLLRPIGQMLEGLGVESFALKVEGSDVLVRGEKKPRSPEPVKETSLRVAWQLLRGKRATPQQETKPSSGVIELRYSPSDIVRLDIEGQSKRQAASNPPEAHSPSQILRAVGAFVDHKGGRFLGVRKQNQDILIEFESSAGRKVEEAFTVATLYEYWVKMYLKRSARQA